LVQQLPVQGIRMVEVDLLPLLERDLFHSPVVGIQRNDGGPGQSLCQLPRQLGLPGAGRTRYTNNVCTHSVVGGVISVYNPTTASTSPSIVKGRASTVTATPSSRAVAEVIGPIEATRTPSSACAPAASTKFRTVDELVNVTQSGRRAKTSRTRSASPDGATVR